MNKVKLSNYIKEFSKKNKNNASYPVYSVTNSNGFCTEYFTKDVSSKDKRNYKIVPYGYFAYNPSRVNVGSIDWQHCEENVIVSPLYTVFCCNEKLDQDFLLYFLKSKRGNDLINSSVSGSVRANLKFKTLCNFEISDISVEEQKKAVINFKKIEDAIKKEQEIISLYDELIRTTYIEFFGEYDKIELHEISKIVMGQSPDSQYYNDDGDGLPFFQGKADFGEKYTTVSHWTSQPSKIAEKGSVLMSVRAPVGPVNIANEKCCIGRGLCSINAISGKTNNDFLFYALKAMQRDIENQGKGSTFKAINKDVVYSLKIPNAPISKQNEFSKIAQSIDRAKQGVFDNIQYLEELLNKAISEFYC